MKVLAPAALALLLAAPAGAMAQTANCAPHRGGELRCAVSGNMRNTSVWLGLNLTLISADSGRPASADAHVWTSSCGAGGTHRATIGVDAPAGGSKIHTLRYFSRNTRHTDFADFCAEVFLLNCRLGGAPTPCDRAISLASQVSFFRTAGGVPGHMVD